MAPKKGTPEWDLWMAALAVAVFPPLKPQNYSVQLSSKLLKDLRDALDACGVDWKKVKAS